MICNTYSSIYLYLRFRGMSMIRHIGPSVTNNYLSMKFGLQLIIYLQHPCRMRWKMKIRTISTCPMNNGVTFCSPWRKNIIDSNLCLKSKYFWPLRQLQKIMIAMHLQRDRSRISQVLASYCPISSRLRKPPHIKVIIITV